MNLGELLEKSRDHIADEATGALARSGMKHYESSTVQTNRERISKLLDLTINCVKNRSLLPMMEYSRGVARERFHAGFGLEEVQTAFNVLEEVIWHRITNQIAPEDYPEAFGLASTVLGVGKEYLAVEYVTLASRKKGVSLDLTALFRGESSG